MGERTASSIDRGRSVWSRVWLLYGCGLIGAAQLGRMSALAPSIKDALGLSLTTVAVAISMIEVGGALLGFGAGRVAQHAGLSRTLTASLACLAFGAIGGSFADGPVGLIGWRLLEAVGYLGIVVTAPVLIAQLGAEAGHRTQALGLTLWSTFFPVGFGVGALAAAATATASGWRTATAASGLVALALWCAVVAARRSIVPVAEPAVDDRAVERVPRAVFLAVAFGSFTFFEVGAIALLPTLLIVETGMTAHAAGEWTAVASVSAVAGSGIAAILARRAGDVRVALGVSLGLPALLLFGLFRSTPTMQVAVVLALVVNTLGGVFIGVAFALLPRVAATRAQLVGANGLIAQCGATGSLLGPPAMAACVQHGGWTVAAVAGLVASLLSLACMTKATRAPS